MELADTSECETAPYANDAIVEALAVVTAAPLVRMKELPNDGLSLDVTPPPRRTVWGFSVALMCIGVAGVAASYVMHVYNPGLPPGFRWTGAPMIMILGLMNLGLAPLILVIQAVQGPPRPVALEIHPGTFRADRSIAGDRVVSSYAADEIDHLFVESGTVFAMTRKGPQLVISFGERDVNLALTTLVASRLWYPDGAAWFDDRRLGRRIFVPASRLRAGR